MNDAEHHPLKPFLPENARLLMLGSFPPQHHRWSMEFFYPNFQNDMWRIIGIIFFDNKNHFVIPSNRTFDYECVVEFCTTRGFAIYDTATVIKRLNNDASDKFLEVVEPTDIFQLLQQIPHCKAVVTTGQKATDTIIDSFHCSKPQIGESTNLLFDNRAIDFFRMPSSSRAYPLSLDKKAAIYRDMFEALKMV